MLPGWLRVWRPKKGPLITWKRGAHLLVGLAVPYATMRLFGYDGLGLGCSATAGAAVLWEGMTPVTGRWFSWAHKWGDVVDLGFFLAGIAISGTIFGAQ